MILLKFIAISSGIKNRGGNFFKTETARDEGAESGTKLYAFSLCKYMSNYYTAIIICSDGTAKKYRDLPINKLAGFELWAVAKFPGAVHVNYYDNKRKFVRQKKFGPDPGA
jgi:hypothetical protein